MKSFATILLGCLALLVTGVQAETGISRSIFTSAIENKEPVSDLKSISSDITRVYFFTELKGLKGHTILHRWEYKGQVFAEISFQIEGDRWRTWSSKNILASWIGTWRVSVLDEGGNVLEQSSFEYTAPEKQDGPPDVAPKAAVLTNETKPEESPTTQNE